ncbi:KGK domain-containing protein [Nostoc sp.]|uniref:KGK domain-containing protein n=1 Tax=Nostoc sp. TaxID=1180 RepID=UPI002FFA1B26
MRSLCSWATKNNYHAPEHDWFSEGGCRCKVLQVKGKGGGWQKGRFRFRLEFIPDDPEAFLKNSPTEPEKTQSPLDDLGSPLDDLRSQLDTQ